MDNPFFKKYGPDDTSGFSMREIKYGRARISLLHAFIDNMQHSNYEEIRIKDLCRKAEVSEPAFYNYFPRKDDLFLYLIRIWSVDIQLHAMEKEGGLAVIRDIFAYSGEKVRFSGISLMKEIIAYQGRTNVDERWRQVRPITPAEKCIIFGAVEGLAALHDRGLDFVLQKNLSIAVQKKELPKKSDQETIGLLLGALLFGLPALLLHTKPDQIAPALEISLDYILQSPFKNPVK